MSLEEALKDSEVIETFEINDTFSYNIDSIKQNLGKILDELKDAKDKIQAGKQCSKSLNTDLLRYKNATTEVLKSLKKLSVIYLELSDNLSSKSKIFNAITVADKIDLDYEMKITKEFNFDSVNKINKLILKYLENAEIRINETESIITKNIAEI